MNRLLLALLAATSLAGCMLLDPSADVSSSQAPLAERDYVTGSHLPARNHNVQGTKVYEVNPIDRSEIFQPKASPTSGS